MAYLIDHLRNNPSKIHPTSECPVYRKEDILLSLQSAVCINAQNIADYWNDRFKIKEAWTLNDISNGKPPFPSIWLEWMLPNEGRDTARIGFEYAGVLVLTGDGKKDENDAMVVGFCGRKNFRNKVFAMFQTSIHTWRYDKNGSVIPSPPDGAEGQRFDLPFLDAALTKKVEDVTVQDWELLLPLLVFSFMNCKNSSLEMTRDGMEESDRCYLPSPLTGKKPVVKIYTLTIDPIKKIIADQNNGDSRLTPKAFHICRGHFKDFSHGQGLFGKYKGTYWWPATVRGDKKYGEVIKDYKVLANAGKA